MDTLDVKDAAFVIYYDIVFLNHKDNLKANGVKVKRFSHFFCGHQITAIGRGRADVLLFPKSLIFNDLGRAPRRKPLTIKDLRTNRVS